MENTALKYINHDIGYHLPAKRGFDRLRPLGELIAGKETSRMGKLETTRNIDTTVGNILLLNSNRKIIAAVGWDPEGKMVPKLQIVESKIEQSFPGETILDIDAREKAVEVAENLIHILTTANQMDYLVEYEYKKRPKPPDRFALDGSPDEASMLHRTNVTDAAQDYATALEHMRELIDSSLARERIKFLTRTKTPAFETIFNLAANAVVTGLDLQISHPIRMRDLTSRETNRLNYGQAEKPTQLNPRTHIEKYYDRMEVSLPRDPAPIDELIRAKEGKPFRAFEIHDEQWLADHHITRQELDYLVGDKVLNGWSVDVGLDGPDAGGGTMYTTWQFQRDWDADPAHNLQKPSDEHSIAIPVDTAELSNRLFGPTNLSSGEGFIGPGESKTIRLSELTKMTEDIMNRSQLAAALGQYIDNGIAIKTTKIDDDLEFTFQSGY